MAHRFIIDDSTGALYSDFTCRRLTSAADILKSERGLSPTLEIYLVNVATDTRAVTGQTLTNADLDIILGSAGKMPDEGIIKIGWNDSGTLYESGYVDVKNLSDDAIAAAFNSAVSPVTDAEGINVDNIGEGKWLLTMKKVGAISGNPTFDVEGCNPPSAVEVSSVRTGDSDTKGQWIISIAQSPVASISGGSFSAVTSGSFSGLSASISLNTTAMIASISRGIKDFELSITHSNQLLHRSPVSIHESLDPTTAGTLIISSPSLFTLGSNAVNQGETIAISGGLTYDGTTLAAPFLPLAGGTMTGDAVFNDGVKAKFGTDSDLQVYHLSGNNYVSAITGGNLFIQGNTVSLRSVSQENLITATANGAVSLFYDAVKKFETTSLGATISGKLIVNGDLDVSGTTTTFNSTVVTVDDPVFTVGGDTAPVASDNKDRGIEFRYMRSGESAKVGFFGYSNADDAFKLLTSATNNSEVFSGTLADLKASKTLLEDGSASAPSVSFSSDNNTGIYRASGDNLAFTTGGTEAARFDSNGNFSIANTATMSSSNAERLIIGNGSDAEGITIFSGNNKGGYLHFADGTIGDQSYRGIIQYSHPLDSFIFRTGGCTESMRLNCTGLGIGGTPTQKLSVIGGHIELDDNRHIQWGGSNNKITGNDASDYIRVFTAGNEAARFDSSGRLGVSSTSPEADIHLGDALVNGFSVDRKTLAVSDITNGAQIILRGQSPRIWFDSTNSGSGEFYLDNSNLKFFQGTPTTPTGELMRLNSTGLGIGGTPSYPLVVKSTSATHQVVAVNRPDSDTAALFLGNNSGLNAIISANNSDLLFGKDFGNTFFEGFRLDTNGHLIFASTTYGANTSENYFRIKFENVGGTANDVGIGQSASGSMDFNINPSGSFIWSRGTSGEAMRLNSTGLGIGGTPDKTFHIKTTAINTAFARIESTANNSYPTLSLKNDAREYQLTAHGGVSDSFVIYDGTVGANRFLIDTSGNVGIGTTSPRTKFHIVGNDPDDDATASSAAGAFLVSNSANSYGIEMGVSSSGDGWIQSHSVTANSQYPLLLNPLGGNVGIGTTAPQKALEISEASLSGGAIMRLTSTGETSAGDVIGKIEFYNSDTTDYTPGVMSSIKAIGGPSGGEGHLQFLTNMPSEGADASTVALHLHSNANVGIGGVTSPSCSLDISGDKIFLTKSSNDAIIECKTTTAGAYFVANSNGTSNFAGLTLEGGGSSNWFVGQYGTADFQVKDGSRSTGAVPFVIQDTTGNIGISTASPSALLHLSASDPILKITDTSGSDNGSTLWLQESDNFGVKLKYDSTSNTFFHISTIDGGTETDCFSIKRTGQVGISTTSPSLNADLTLGNGELCMAETTTPTADANFGKIYCKSDNKLYFQDGAGTEHEIAFV